MMRLRKATAADVLALEKLIERSARALGAARYSEEQIEGALGTAWGVDTQLIADGTYWVAESERGIAGCGGWSRRKTLFGGDRAAKREAELLDSARDAARIRAFFVEPGEARKGVGRAILLACEGELRREGFRAAELVATLPGEPFYQAFGYREVERLRHALPNGAEIEFVRMRKVF